MTNQPEALRLADLLAEYLGADHPAVSAISDELRRLHEVNAALLAALRGMVALEEETLRNCDDDDISCELQFARAAIAKAEDKP